MSSLHLSRICIDHESAWKAGLRDTYAWHQQVWKAFPARSGQARHFLTRLDDTEAGFRLLILSETAPVRPDWCPEPAWSSKPVPDSFYEHEYYQFSLHANPTRKVRSDANGNPKRNGRRVPLVKRDELLSWLERKGTAAGFSFDSSKTRTIPRPQRVFVKQGRAGLHSATEFAGRLRVTDRDAFRTAAIHGIGPAKAFGFGLLCLAPEAATQTEAINRS